MNANEALSILRNNPTHACSCIGFLTKADEIRTKTGGPCTIRCAKIAENIFELDAKAGGRDYYFPYIPGGLGTCEVPRTAPVGTIVLTGGMNGCVLQVDRINSHFLFIHDANGRHIRPNPPITVCRVDYCDYAGPPTSRGIGLGISFALSKVPSMDLKPYPCNTILCVKEQDRWKVYSSGIMFHYADKKYKKNKYFPFQSSLSPCITSFDH